MKLAPVAAFMMVCATGFAQQWESMQVRITGTSGERGKCTIDLVVDGTVEVEVAGQIARARAMSGARPQWRRFQCNMPMPPNPAEFRFMGQEGRGRQTLLRDPNQNRGVTLVRIEDEDPGSEGYKFDVEWRGTQSSSGGGFGGGDDPFDRPGRGKGGVILNGGPGLAGWNDEINYRGRGDGYFRDFRGQDEMLRDAVVTVDRRGRVQVDLTTNRRDRIVLSGQLISTSRNRLTANITNGPAQGTMDILLKNRDRVQELAMTGVGRNRFELRWQPR